MVTYICSEGKHIFMCQGAQVCTPDTEKLMPSKLVIDWFASQGVEKISVIPLSTGYAMKLEDDDLALAFRMRFC